ncbi:MAG: ATP-binding protein [Psychromonas sp.]
MQWKSNNSLVVKIFLSFWLLIALLVSALILLPQLDNRGLQTITSADFQEVAKQSKHLREIIDKNPLLGSLSILALLPKNTDTEIYLTDLSGRLISATAPRKMFHFILDSQSPEVPLKQINTYRTYFGPVLLQYKQHHVLIYASIPNKKTTLALVEWLLDNPLLLLLTALIISTPICVIFAWYLTLPLRRLRDLSTQVAQGNLDITFPIIKHNNEFTILSQTLQQMVLSLKSIVSHQQHLLSDISHELRSPLTRLNLALALTKKYHGETKELKRIELEASRMEEMIAEMLNLSQIQLQQGQKENISLDEFLEDLFLDAQFEAEECHKLFTYPELCKEVINIYPELAYRAIENVIRNAIKYAHWEISVQIDISTHNITLIISNDGELISERELKNIFRPFYRLNESRQRETGGVGLGLSIAENAMIKHGGKIWADNLGNKVLMHLQFPRLN